MAQRYRFQKLWPVIFYPMTRAERDALVSPPEFACIVNTDDSELQLYAGGAWQAIAKYAPGGSANIYAQLHTFDDDTTALEVRRTQTDPVPTIDAATSGWLELPPVDHTLAASANYRVEIDGPGLHTVATFKWSNDEGVSWEATELSMVDANGEPISIELEEGIIIKFGPGEYVLADRWDWTAIGTADQLYDLAVDTQNSIVKVGTRLYLGNDPDFSFYHVGGFPTLNFDAGSDYLQYDRSANSFVFRIGGVPVIITATQLLLYSKSLFMGEISTPSNPAANYAKFYAKDIAGLTRPHWLDSTPTESVLAFTSEIIPATLLDAKGDLIAATAADTPARLAVGADGKALIADSAEATGLKYADPIPNPGLVAHVHDDFMGGNITSGSIGEMGWSFVGGTTALSLGVANHPGIVMRYTGATINTITTLYLSDLTSNCFLPADTFDMTWIIRTGTLVTSQELRFGAMDSALAPPVSGIFFQLDTAVGTHWYAVTRTVTLQTATDTGITVALSTWYKLRIVRVGADILFYINDALVATNSATIPVAALSPIGQIENLVAVTRSFGVDLFDMKIAVTR